MYAAGGKIKMPTQKDLQRELNARIPRQRSGSLQNRFRHDYWFYRAQGNSFGVSCELALTGIHAEHPEFVPTILP